MTHANAPTAINTTTPAPTIQRWGGLGAADDGTEIDLIGALAEGFGRAFFFFLLISRSVARNPQCKQNGRPFGRPFIEHDAD